MTTAYDVPAEKLIASIAEELKKMEYIKPPEWSSLVKTGVHRERSPEKPDWWHTRVAAVLRKIYIYGPIGTEKLSAHFGGPVDKGSKPTHAWSGSRAIIRLALQQLELSGLVAPYKKLGRVVSPQGQKILDNTSYAIFKEMVKDNPKLAKYGK
ncbi:MAG: 30S ribosomal protein S19e [Candidatus Thermoplasmatota archaeon]|nr:30S ribosomal protein S19e [Euryarchaeota archaeon]MBU4032759.1 30S ribosomal protein S19e [Candidatus Thermoplasmatota archaeon]MBU4070851.1 30S ribosomal protein S19e [Candidatus Thermoplasmatota archaeon]MBU4143416.1 30S ribosomal protein S19e [Candidatus Thermoplasmatota archaeon]MBU4592445.1 30S ribosomal protein S19e [Candidatus Thermoplasmatota archaeon]